jgi:hypothetical protein
LGFNGVPSIGVILFVFTFVNWLSDKGVVLYEQDVNPIRYVIAKENELNFFMIASLG